MIIHYTKHAENKFFILQEHGCHILKEDITALIKLPEDIVDRKDHVIVCGNIAPNADPWEIIYTKESNVIKVLTFYPIKKKEIT